MGALQAVLTQRGFSVPFYVLGTLILFGVFLGRWICGWLCPFGWVQDVVYRIPGIRKVRRLAGERGLRLIRYGVLGGFCVILPLVVLDVLGQGSPWFCKVICPSGTLFAGIPLVLAQDGLRSVVGWLFAWKLVILVGLLLLAAVVYRPFCRYVCPLGAIYGLFNPIAVVRYSVDAARCTQCGRCEATCPMGLDVKTHPNTPDCIRCGRCLKACPVSALRVSLKREEKTR